MVEQHRDLLEALIPVVQVAAVLAVFHPFVGCSLYAFTQAQQASIFVQPIAQTRPVPDERLVRHFDFCLAAVLITTGYHQPRIGQSLHKLSDLRWLLFGRG